jgi:preprotein translocase subunit SecA
MIFSIFQDANKKYVSKIQSLVDEINAIEKDVQLLTDNELRQETTIMREHMQREKKIPDDFLPGAFAVMREAAKRTLKQRHFDVQLMGGIALHQGKIAEMKTGEGKTLAATLPAYLNALEGKGVHVVTVNDYLSRRDAAWMGQIYHFLGLSVGCLNHEQAFLYDPEYRSATQEDVVKADEERDRFGSFKVYQDYLRPVDRKTAYMADILYGTNNEFGFDYLRDNLVYNIQDKVQRGHNYAIVDEIDSILIDEARTPLIISVPDEDSSRLYKDFAKITPRLKENVHYSIDEKLKAVTLTQEGIDEMERILGLTDMYNVQNLRMLHHMEQALRAQMLFRRDKEYVIKGGEIIIVDEFTGRLMPGRRYSDGLHQAIEAKENVEVKQESRTMASITFQNYFRMYKKLSGMTGTAQTSAEEFHKVYNLEVATIPTNLPCVRADRPDTIYKTEKGKFIAILNKVRDCRQTGQPVLIGTVSIEKNELLSAMLQRDGVPHQVLNAKNHEQEAEIIAQAGKFGAVTVATNMAGRGVDILLGGNPPDPWDKEKVVSAGGLLVIGTERHESRRIDNQLRGRCGRQGDPGESQFYVSLEDELMRIFGSDRIKDIMEMLNIPETQPIENNMISRAIESAQAKIEGMHFDSRKYVLDFDEVLNKQRNVIYGMRNDMLDVSPERAPVLRDRSTTALRDFFLHIVDAHCYTEDAELWNVSELIESIKSITGQPGDIIREKITLIRDDKARDWKERKRRINDFILSMIEQLYIKKEEQVGQENMRMAEQALFLRIIDIFWMEHLENMEHLKNTVRLQAYGQKDPLIEYKNQGHQLFQELLKSIQGAFANSILKVGAQQIPKQQSENGGKQQNMAGVDLSKVGRNDECPCGSGLKFKKCHGK